MPKLSIILDNYNYADFLPQAIESVLTQTHTDFELIIVDDGSTDRSREIIQKYSDARIHKIFKKNGGQTSAFNAGFESAKGDIIALLDSDDYWYPEKLETIIEAHKTSQIVQHYLSTNGKEIYRKIVSGVDWSAALTEYGYMYQHSPTSALSFAREIIEPFFPLLYEEEMRGYSDGCLLMLAMVKSKVFCLDKVLGFYRIHGKNLNANRSDSGAALLDVSIRQRNFVNKQLRSKRLPELPMDDGQYINILLQAIDFGNLPVVVYGTGNSGICIGKVLEQRGIKLWGFANSKGEEAVSPSELLKKKDEFGKIVIASSAQDEIVDILLKAGIENERIVRLAI